MEITASLISADTAAAAEATSSLDTWLQRENFTNRISPITAAPRPDQMGLDPVTILAIVLGSEAVVQLVKSIHVWITATRPKVDVKLKSPSGKTLEISATNLPSQEMLLRSVEDWIK
jgi:hypothetical protein